MSESSGFVIAIWPRVYVFKGQNQKWYWHLKAENGEIQCDSAQGYATKSNAIRAAKDTQKGFSHVEGVHFH